MISQRDAGQTQACHELRFCPNAGPLLSDPQRHLRTRAVPAANRLVDWFDIKPVQGAA
jgi:hypothetical protein